MARRESGIYKRKDGRYEARYIKGYDANGKARYGAVYARSYAEVKLKRERVKPYGKPDRQTRSQTVAAAVSEHIDASKNQIKASTYSLYRRYLDGHIASFFSETRCDRLTVEAVQGFFDGLVEGGLCPATAQSVFTLLKTALKHIAPSDVFDIKTPKRRRQEVDFLSIDEQKRLEAAAKDSDPVNRIGVILCLYTGIRVGELCGLKWDDVDFEGRKLLVRRTVQRINADGDTDGENGNGGKTNVVILTPKSGSSQRSIPLPDFLLNLLKEHRERADGEFILSRKGLPFEPRNMQYRFKTLLDKAGVKRVNFHATRHTFATRALENGFDVKTLSEILGHSSASITLSKYAHVTDEHKRLRMESLAALYQ